MSKASQRDPVCEAIEQLVGDLESRNGVSLQKVVGDHSFELRFGDIRVEGVTYDVALVRLASAMMDDENYSKHLMEALRAPMQSSIATKAPTTFVGTVPSALTPCAIE